LNEKREKWKSGRERERETVNRRSEAAADTGRIEGKWTTAAMNKYKHRCTAPDVKREGGFGVV